MFKTCLAQEIGTDAVLLLTAIAHTEDAKRYSGPVTYYNDQLQSLLGFRKWDRLDRARKAAIDAGWLHYETQSRRKPGVYWVTVPDGFESFDDAPTDEGLSPLDGYKEGYSAGYKAGLAASTKPQFIPSTGDERGDKEGMNEGIKRGQTRGQSGDERGDKEGEPSTLIPNPTPDPIPSPKETAAAQPKESSKHKHGSCEVPEALKTPGFLAAWTDWLGYRLDSHKPYKTAIGERRALSRLSEWGADRAEAAILYSIGQEYQGIFEERNGAHQNSNDDPRGNMATMNRYLEAHGDGD